MNWEIIGKIKASKIRVRILSVLNNRELSPKEIQLEIQYSFPQISRSLYELLNLGVIECLNPKIRKGRIYKITPLGKEVLEKLEK